MDWNKNRFLMSQEIINLEKMIYLVLKTVLRKLNTRRYELLKIINVQRR